MNNANTARKTLLTAIIVLAIGTVGVISATDYSFAQANNGAGANNGGGKGGGNDGGGRGGGGDDGGREGDGSSALDYVIVVDRDSPPDVIITRVPPRIPRTPPRKPIQSVSIAADCSCQMRTVRSGGQLIRIKDCYKISGNRIQYCEPLAH